MLRGRASLSRWERVVAWLVSNCSLVSLTLWTAGLFCAFIAYLSIMGKCNMTGNLKELLVYSTTVLHSNKIDYWLDYGTLLGAVRDHGIIPHEFDIDMGVREEECENVLALRSQVYSDKGWYLYGRGEYIAAKRSYWTGDDGYLLMPCARLYDQAHKYYVDIYWYRLVGEAERMNATYPRFYPPAEWEDTDLLCNQEGFTGELPGGCKPLDSVFPLSTVTMLGGHSFSVPHDPDVLLEEMYPNWRKPTPKGYKHICAIAPSRTAALALVGFALAAVALRWAWTRYRLEAKLCPRINSNWLVIDNTPFRWR